MERQFDYTDFYKRNYTSAVFFACKYTRNMEDARDVVGECFLKLLEKDRILKVAENVASLFFVMLHNLCVDYLRRLQCHDELKRHVKQTVDLLSDDELTGLCQKEMFRILGTIIAEIPEEERAVFCKIRLDGNSYKEVALQRNIGVRRVEYRLNMASGMIRERFLKRYG